MKIITIKIEKLLNPDRNTKIFLVINDNKDHIYSLDNSTNKIDLKSLKNNTNITIILKNKNNLPRFIKMRLDKIKQFNMNDKKSLASFIFTISIENNNNNINNNELINNINYHSFLENINDYLEARSINNKFLNYSINTSFNKIYIKESDNKITFSMRKYASNNGYKLYFKMSKIYIPMISSYLNFGGTENQNTYISESNFISIFSPFLQDYEIISNIDKFCYFSNIIFINDFLYIISGLGDGMDAIRNIVEINLKNNKKIKASIQTNRYNFFSIFILGKLFLLCGKNKNTYIESVEYIILNEKLANKYYLNNLENNPEILKYYSEIENIILEKINKLSEKDNNLKILQNLKNDKTYWNTNYNEELYKLIKSSNKTKFVKFNTKQNTKVFTHDEAINIIQVFKCPIFPYKIVIAYYTNYKNQINFKIYDTFTQNVEISKRYILNEDSFTINIKENSENIYIFKNKNIFVFPLVYIYINNKNEKENLIEMVNITNLNSIQYNESFNNSIIVNNQNCNLLPDYYNKIELLINSKKIYYIKKDKYILEKKFNEEYNFKEIYYGYLYVNFKYENFLVNRKGDKLNLPNNLEVRKNHLICETNDNLIWLIGGYNNNIFNRSIEYFDFKLLKWYYLFKFLPFGFKKPGKSFYNENTVYIYGGINESDEFNKIILKVTLNDCSPIIPIISLNNNHNNISNSILIEKNTYLILSESKDHNAILINTELNSCIEFVIEDFLGFKNLSLYHNAYRSIVVYCSDNNNFYKILIDNKKLKNQLKLLNNNLKVNNIIINKKKIYSKENLEGNIYCLNRSKNIDKILEFYWKKLKNNDTSKKLILFNQKNLINFKLLKNLNADTHDNYILKLDNYSSISLPNGKIIISGGYIKNSNEILINSKIFIIDIKKKFSYKQFNSFNFSIYDHGSAYINKNLMIFGGVINNIEGEVSDEVFYYDEKLQTFVKIMKLNKKKAGFSYITIYNKYILIIGGYTKINGKIKYLNEIEKIDLEHRNSEIIGKLPIKFKYSSVILKEYYTILIIGGLLKNNKANFNIIEYNFINKSIYFNSNILTFPRVKPILYKINNKLYIYGGNKYNNSYEIISLDKRIKKLDIVNIEDNENILYKGITTYFHKTYENKKFKGIYVFGGDNNPFIYRMDTDSFEWEELHIPKNLKLWDMSRAISLPNGLISLTGGTNSMLNDIKNTNYLVDLQNNNCNVLQSMNQARYYHSGIYLNGYLYILGGKFFGMGEQAIINHCERFNFKKNKWTNISPMNIKRSNFETIIYSNKIYAVGGSFNKSKIKLIEKYNEHLDTWEIIKLNLNLAIESFGMAKINENSFLITGGKSELKDREECYILDFERCQVDSMDSLNSKKINNYLYQINDLKLISFGGNNISNYEEINLLSENKEWVVKNIPNIFTYRYFFKYTVCQSI